LNKENVSAPFTALFVNAATGIVRAVGVSRIVYGWRTSSKHRVETRGARRPKQRAMYRNLTSEQKTRLRFMEVKYRIELELEFLEITDCPITLSTDTSISITSRVSAFWRNVMHHELEKDAAACSSEHHADESAGPTAELIRARPVDCGSTEYLEMYSPGGARGGPRYLEMYSPGGAAAASAATRAATKVLARTKVGTLGLNRPPAFLLGGYESFQIR